MSVAYEATAEIADDHLARMGVSSLLDMLTGLRMEAFSCTEEADYAPVRAQIDRVRSVLIARGVL